MSMERCMMVGCVAIEKKVKTAVELSPRVLETSAMFGLGVDANADQSIVAHCEIPLPHLRGERGIVFVTGPSGSGKSTILKLIASQLRERGDASVISFDEAPALAEQPLVEAFAAMNVSLSQTLSIFSIAGLSDAFVMLRTPSQLSDGQRYRLRLAQVIALMAAGEVRGEESKAVPCAILADEFGATLDRVTARTVSANLRRWINKPGPALSFIAATTHDDLLEALQPDVLVWKDLGDEAEVVSRYERSKY